MATRFRAATFAAVLLRTLPAAAGPHGAQPQLRTVGAYESGLFNVGGAEIPAFDPLSRRAFVVNAGSATVDVLDLRNPHRPARVASLDVVADLAPRSVGAANSVDTRFGLLAIAVEADPKQDDGYVAFYSTFSLKLVGVAPATCARFASTASTPAVRAITSCPTACASTAPVHPLRRTSNPSTSQPTAIRPG